MLIKELIAKLQELPSDAEVLRVAWEFDTCHDFTLDKTTISRVEDADWEEMLWMRNPYPGMEVLEEKEVYLV